MALIYRIYLLGSVQVEKQGQLLRGFDSRKALALLGYLARQKQPVSRSLLAGLFWGDKEEARGRRNLSRELSQLSAQLHGCFQADYHTVQFVPPETCWVDTHHFANLVSAGGGQPGAKSHSESSPSDWFPWQLAEGIQTPLLAEAVALYRGDFMSGYFLDDCPEFETWLVREQEGWRRQVTELLERLITFYARTPQDDQALVHARRWLELEPWRERAHRYLMLLLAGRGDRTAALAQFEICRRVLAEELAVEPSTETLVVYEQIRSGQLSRSKTPSVASPPVVDLVASATPIPLHKVPLPATSFVGREEELAQIKAHLDDPACRLLTLVGPGGVGKTRLAIQAAWEAARQSPTTASSFADGVYFIPLDAVSSAEFLISTLADALNFSFYSGINPASQLYNYLREKQLLLALDNFEHLLTGADLVADILNHAPQVKILVISRERLNLQEEYLLPIQGLKVPEADFTPRTRQARGHSALEAYSAVQLFLQRAQTIRADFTLSDAEKPCVIHVCRLAEGSPLAIELAAAWLRLLSCQEIAQEIEQNLDFLTTSLRNVPERQRSLRAVFDYSWQLLSADEKRVFRQLAVFTGGFQQAAAKQVVGASLPLLLALVDKSLLRRTETGRYTRHVLLWQYAAEKLAELPQEKEIVQERHGSYYAAFLQAREAGLKGGQQRETLAEIGAELENIRAGWRWAVERPQRQALEQALESLFHFYDMRSWFHEGAEMFELAATRLTPQAAPEANPSHILLGKLLARQGWFTFQLGQQEPAQLLLQQSLSLLRQSGPDALAETVFPLNYLGALHRHLGQYEPAQQYLQESLAICREVGDTFGLTIALNILSQVAYLVGEYEQARQLGQESLALKQKIGDHRGVTFSLDNLGQVAFALGEYPQAKDLFEDSLAICQEIGDHRGIALCLNYLGDVVHMMGEYQGARQLYQESLAIFKEIGNQWGIVSAHTKLGYIADQLGEPQAARSYFSDALKMAVTIQALPGAMDALVGLASLLIKAGAPEQVQALEILALVLSHPASSRDNQNRAARLLAEVEPSWAAAKTGQHQDVRPTLETIVKKILDQEKG